MKLTIEVDLDEEIETTLDDEYQIIRKSFPASTPDFRMWLKEWINDALLEKFEEVLTTRRSLE